MRYWPLLSEIAVRTFSISAGLDGFDGDARQHGAGAVADGAGERRLRVSQRRKEQERRQEEAACHA